MVRALDLRLRRSRVRLPASRFQLTTLGKLFTLICLCHATPEVAGSTPGLALSATNPGQVGHTHTRASVTKQYNLVPVKGRLCPAVGKVTVGLASRWPSVTDFRGLSVHLQARGLRKGDEHPAYTLHGLWHSFTRGTVSPVRVRGTWKFMTESEVVIRGVHGNGKDWDPMGPMGFPWEWE